MVRLRTCFAFGAVAALAGCASSGSVPPPRPQDGAAQPVISLPGPAATTLDAANLIGRTAGQLSALFGQPALDVREGTARKLQYLGERCVLDAYLYPGRTARGEPVVTHVDTRLPDGRDAERTSCIASLRRR